MYRCIDCGEIFEEPTSWEEQEEFWGARVGREESGCPFCKGDYEEVYQCDECGEWYTEDEYNLENDICNDCMTKEIESIDMETLLETAYKAGTLKDVVDVLLSPLEQYDMIKRELKDKSALDVMYQDVEGWYTEFKKQGVIE